MWVTPDVIDDQQFTHRRLRGGYDEAEVDDFLDLVSCHVGEMQDYISRLEAELDELRSSQEVLSVRQEDAIQPAPGRGGAAPVPPLFPGGQAGVGPNGGSDAYPPVPVGPYLELSPDRLDATNGGRPTNVPRPEEVMPLGSGRDAPRPERQLENVPRPGREVTAGPVSGPRRESEDRAGPGHPFDPIASWQLPAFVPLRTLADEIAEDAEEYLRSEAAAKAAREDPDPRVWQTFQDARRAAWCQRVGLDAAPIEWSTT